jgi:hypothetical protein
MQCDTSRIKRWEKPDLIHNAMEKNLKVGEKKKKTRRANNQPLAFYLAHDLKRI